jgi:hypothetical protein
MSDLIDIGTKILVKGDNHDKFFPAKDRNGVVIAINPHGFYTALMEDGYCESFMMKELSNERWRSKRKKRT